MKLNIFFRKLDYKILISLLIFLIFVVVIFYLFFNNKLFLGGGGEAQRCILGLEYGINNPFGEFFSFKSLSLIWPPGHQSAIRFLFTLFNPSSVKNALFAYHFLSILLFFIGIFCFSLVAKNKFGKKFFSLSILMFLSSYILTRLSYTGMPDVFYFCALGISFYYIYKYLEEDKLVYSVISALPLFLVNTIRLESIVVSFFIFLFLVLRRKIFGAFVFGVISSFYFVLKLFYVFFFDRNNPYNFVLHNKNIYKLGEPFLILKDMFHRFFLQEENFIIFSALIAALIIIFMTVNFFLKKKYKVKSSLFSNFNFPIELFVFLGILTFVIFSIFSGSMFPFTRYLMSLIPFFILIVLLLIFKFTNSLGNKKISFVFINTVFMLFLVLSLFSINRLRHQETFLKNYEIEVVNFFNKNKFGNSSVFDFLLWKEHAFMLYTMNMNVDNNSCMYSYSRSFLPAEHINKNSEVLHERARAITINMHQYLYYMHSRYLVIAKDEYFKNKVNKYKHTGSHGRNSYIRPYLKKKGSDEYLLDSPYIPGKIILKEVFTNNEYVILESNRANLLRNPNRIDGPFWEVEGDVKIARSSQKAPDPYLRAYKGYFPSKSSIRQKAVLTGSNGNQFSAGIWLWSESKNANITLLLKSENEIFKNKIVITGKSTFYKISNKFKSNCNELEIEMLNENNLDITVYVWGAIVVRGSDATSVPVKL